MMGASDRKLMLHGMLCGKCVEACPEKAIKLARVST
jgi:ferredoxin